MAKIVKLTPHPEQRARYFLSLEGPLHQVPFAALHDDKGWLLGRHQFTYLISGASLLRPLAPDPIHTDVAVFADPDFAGSRFAPAMVTTSMGRTIVNGGGNSTEFLPLPGARREAESIAKILTGVTKFLGAAATKAAFLAVPAPGVLHVATHGIFLPNQMHVNSLRDSHGFLMPLMGELHTRPQLSDSLVQSALVLASTAVIAQATSKADLTKTDSLVTALDVRGMNLWGTQLVVLSACNSGRGQIQIGEGVFGLQRAFFTAGAETLVTSLWKVADRETHELMEGYYQRLASGVGRVDAMDQAAVAMKNRHPHPYFWFFWRICGRS